MLFFWKLNLFNYKTIYFLNIILFHFLDVICASKEKPFLQDNIFKWNDNILVQILIYIYQTAFKSDLNQIKFNIQKQQLNINWYVLKIKMKVKILNF